MLQAHFVLVLIKFCINMLLDVNLEKMVIACDIKR